MAPIHDRMPVILQPSDWRTWLDADCQDRSRLQSLLRPADEDVLEYWEVGSYVNHARHEGAECIAKVM